MALCTSPIWGGTAWVVGNLLYYRWYVWTDEDRGFHGDEGLPSDARRWKAVIGPIPDPEHVGDDLAAERDYFVLRFPNGEWVFGIAVQSHKFFTQGGTLVLKDSRGQVRVFYGHVCSGGGSYMTGSYNSARTLTEFYRLMEEFKNFKEQTLDG